MFPPQVLEARFEVSALRPGAEARFVLVADEPLNASCTRIAEQAPADLPLSRLQAVGSQATFGAVVDNRASFVVVSAVEVCDAEGNRAIVEVSASVRVDGTLPVLADVRARARADGGDVVSPAAGFDGVSVTGAVSEEAFITCSFGDDVAAAAVDAFGFSCDLSASGISQSGSVDVIIDAVDVVGNSTSVRLPLGVDALGPLPIPQTVRLRQGGRDVPNPAAFALGARFTVELALDEAASEVPTLSSGSLGQISFAAVTGEALDAFFVFEARVDQVIVPGPVSLQVTARDRFGQAATSTLPWTLNLEDFPSTPCPASPACVDVDGDGFLGVSAACPRDEFSDCDDGNVRVFPGAPEIPADGLTNDCAGQEDEAITDENAVFFRAVPGPLRGDVSRAAPFTDIPSDIDWSDKHLVLAVGRYASPFRIRAKTITGGASDDFSVFPPGARSVIGFVDGFGTLDVEAATR